ncbi:MAG: sel1 repeat family protein [Chitinophagia bacterium]|nr:sel1 repeat family protein [Chitinophagia bacterium]
MQDQRITFRVAKDRVADYQERRDERAAFEEAETTRAFLAASCGATDPTASTASTALVLSASLRRMTFLVGTMYLHGRGTPRNTAVATRMFLDAANLGDAHAIVVLAEMYPFERFRLYRWAAELGHEYAQLWVACMYHEGIEIEHDAQAALRWYRAAAEQGNESASLRIAQMFVEGAVSFKPEPEEF